MRNYFDHLLDQPMPGGCDDCNAVQTFTEADGVYVLQVQHDDTCPELARIEGRR